jgi:hypothetical protein
MLDIDANMLMWHLPQKFPQLVCQYLLRYKSETYNVFGPLEWHVVHTRAYKNCQLIQNLGDVVVSQKQMDTPGLWGQYRKPHDSDSFIKAEHVLIMVNPLK